MLALRAFVLLFPGLLGLVAATPDLSAVPSCAISCMIRAAPYTKCSLSDQACLCVDPGFNTAVAPCIQANCTIKETLVVTNQTWSQCNFPLTDKTSEIHWVSSVMFVLSTVFIGMRLASKAMKLSTWGTDDTAIVVAYALIVGFFILQVYWVRAGMGKDIWTLHPYDITLFLKMLWAMEFFYIVGLAVIKASILFFFLRIFPDRRFRRALWAMQTLSLLVGLTFTLVSIVQCQPVSHMWDGWDGEHAGSCVDLNRIGLSHVAMNITLDVIMLSLPITQLYKLQMDRRKKIGVMSMFLVGIFLTIVSCLRVKTLIVFATSLNITADMVTAVLWVHVELGVGVVVACMPSVRQLLKTLPSKVVQLTTSFASSRMWSRLSSSRTVVETQVYSDKPNKLLGDPIAMTPTTIRTNSLMAPSVTSHEGGHGGAAGGDTIQREGHV